MFKTNAAFSGFSVDDIDKAQKFYTEVLGFKCEVIPGMGMTMHLPGGGTAYVYPKDDHQPATYTMLNLDVDDIDQAVEALKSEGIEFEHYEGMTDDKGIARGISQKMGPDIAWFKDPAGNIISVLHNEDK